ncbi:maleylpyruvate isomerase family mycothiol-dependent enzyme [Mycobacterium sp. SMC-16]|uniref:maleylpyruvate isomerase family mycothiol-dependent enzyme n=1 Tax=Mycobacteriaceae TaxID=1762 RepID=UPI001CFA4997|nr:MULTISPECIES: maleylpyruvate isomerase family mycothiol-dependent enzyme [Mycolicibacterium]MCX8554781.1 maleylpyruvate isomerase family mycothiol-dependent enzyme [Mycolicibacterium mucogenicum]UCZ63617.1 maleylpyruvate isomerase family mycothiol-dependent enzyme [Mycolicibacterium phocaicum]
MAMARAERQDLVDFLGGLSAEQWEQPSLCTGWRVRDVVGHIIGYDELSGAETVREFLRGGLFPPRINAAVLARHAGRSIDELRAALAAHVVPRGLTTGFRGRIALSDAMIHQQDIRRPLGLPRQIPPERLTAVLDFARYAPLLRGAWRARGVRLVATDLDWSFGRGPVASGPAEALLMVMVARPCALDDLTGPGVGRLRRNLGA